MGDEPRSTKIPVSDDPGTQAQVATVILLDIGRRLERGDINEATARREIADRLGLAVRAPDGVHGSRLSRPRRPLEVPRRLRELGATYPTGLHGSIEQVDAAIRSLAGQRDDLQRQMEETVAVLRGLDGPRRNAVCPYCGGIVHQHGCRLAAILRAADERAKPPTRPTVAESFAALQEAAGGAWDGIDPDEYTRMMRDDEPPTSGEEDR